MPSNSLDNNHLIDSINITGAEISRYLSIFLFIIGGIGNILNILIFCQRQFRTNPCAFFFLVSSIASLISNDFGLVTRVLSSWLVDPTSKIGWLCKLRNFIVFSARAIVFWSIVLATIDRWFASSTNIYYQQLRTLKNARRATWVVILISILVHLQLFYCYDTNSKPTVFSCDPKTPTCRIITDVTFAVYTTILPVVCMFIFGLKTILNIRRSKRRIMHVSAVEENRTVVNTSNSQQQQQMKKMDHQLLRMLFIQIIVFSLLTLPQAIDGLYLIAVGSNRSQLGAAIDRFIYTLLRLLTYLASLMPFYMYTLFGGSLFRSALLDVIKSFFQLIMCKHRCCCRRSQ